jgi:hypothetical protein
MDAMGARIKARKEALLTTIKQTGLPPPQTRSYVGHKLVQSKPVEA